MDPMEKLVRDLREQLRRAVWPHGCDKAAWDAETERLIAAARSRMTLLEMAVAGEREACAKLADSLIDHGDAQIFETNDAAKTIAAAIRARKE